MQLYVFGVEGNIKKQARYFQLRLLVLITTLFNGRRDFFSTTVFPRTIFPTSIFSMDIFPIREENLHFFRHQLTKSASLPTPLSRVLGGSPEPRPRLVTWTANPDYRPRMWNRNSTTNPDLDRQPGIQPRTPTRNPTQIFNPEPDLVPRPRPPTRTTDP